MNIDPTDTSTNPFAAPESREQAPESPPLTTHSFKIVGLTLYCKGSLNLSDTCWLTGSPDVLFRKKTIKKRVGREWPTWTSALMVILCLSSNFTELIGLPKSYRRFAPLAFMALLGFKYLASLQGTQFELMVGQSRKAVNSEIAARRFLWMQIPIHVGFVVAAALFSPLTMAWFPIVMAWVIGWTLVYFHWNPTTFRMEVRKDKEGTFIVTGLQSKFLTALRNRLTERPDSE